MRRLLLPSTKGAAAVEFALVAPIFIMMIILLVQGAIAFQQWNAMNAVTGITTRCIALNSPRCTPASGYSGTGPGTTYAIQVAAANGAGIVTQDMVTIDTVLSTTGGITFRRVSITRPVTILGGRFNLTSASQFPQS